MLSCAWLLASSVPVWAQEVAPTDPVQRPESTETAAERQEARPVADHRHLSTTLAPAAGGFGSLIQDTVHDFRHLGSTDALKWLGLGMTAAMAVRPLDGSVSNSLSGQPQLDKAFDAGQTIGGARLQLAGALATLGVGRLTSSARTTAIGADLLKAQIISQALTAGIKMSVRRTRPDGAQYSFPSGHSSVTFASATVLQRHLGWDVGIPAYAIASYVAASRVQEQRHFLSDVAFGATIGIVAGRAVTIGRGGHRLAVSPMATPGGGGVTFTWLGRH